MSVEKRGKVFHLRIRPFGPALITVRTRAQTKMEAVRIERAVWTACASGDYRSLDPASRAVCIAMFRNRGWEIPPDLSGNEPVKEELTMWKAVDLFLNYPEIRQSPTRWRYECSLIHLVNYFDKEFPIKNLWVPGLKAYQIERRNEGAAPATINREMSTLSKVFNVLIELQLGDNNPVRLTKRLSEKSGERQIYLSYADFQRITELVPSWFQPIIKTAFYTGMRRGEILSLTRKQVNLSRRMLLLGPKNTKEEHWKRVPIHRDLVPILQECLKVTSLESDKVFLIKDIAGIRPPCEESLKNPWRKAVKAIELIDPRPRFNDLRHTFKGNALSSHMDPEIRESIMGHWYRGKTVTERYGRIKDDLLLKAIDSMTFDHGDTEILVGSGPAETPGKDVRKMCANVGTKRKSGCSRSSITP